MLYATLIIAVNLLHTFAEPSLTFEVDVETRSENKPPLKHDQNIWLRTNPEMELYKRGYHEGSISESGLTFRNAKKETITCLADSENAQLKGSSASKSTTKFAKNNMNCINGKKIDQHPRFLARFKAEPPSLRDQLSTPHGTYGGWLPFNPHLHLVHWPHPVASYMLSYDGIFGCAVLVAGQAVCPTQSMIGPFAMRDPMGNPFFLLPGATENMPFVPAS
tara:strand:+ start:44 stop:703 length:660 start_codon:yes stop_codon:yes gene_type:complete